MTKQEITLEGSWTAIKAVIRAIDEAVEEMQIEDLDIRAVYHV